MSSIGLRLERVLAEDPPHGLVAAYLFGSQAERREHRESDVDVGVVLRRDAFPDARDRFRERLRLSAWLAARLGREVDLVILNDAPPTLAARVTTTGIRVFCADAGLEHAFRRDAQLRAGDLAPFLARLRRVKLDAILR